MSFAANESLSARRALNNYHKEKVEKELAIIDKKILKEKEEELVVKQEEEMKAISLLKNNLLMKTKERLKLTADFLQHEERYITTCQKMVEQESKLESQILVLDEAEKLHQPKKKRDIIQKNKKIKSLQELVIYFDGASKKNPGESGAGWIMKNSSNRECVALGWKFFPHATNNEAEYSALIQSLQYLNEKFLRAKKVKKEDDDDTELVYSIKIFGDSNLVVKQVLGEFKCTAPNLVPYCKEATQLFASTKRQVEALDISHIRRESNFLADCLSNIAVSRKDSKICQNVNEIIDDVSYLKTKFG